jgi:hypothetical protein
VAGLSGAALFVGVGGLYLAYAGVRDVPLVEGLRSLLRGERPAEKQPAWAPITMDAIAAQEGDGAPPPSGTLTGDSGISRLRGNAALAYPVLKAAFPHLRMGGWRPSGSVPNSDHPKGLAIDVMTGDNAMAGRIIGVARRTPGLRNWIWSRHYASVNTGWRRTPCGGHCGPSPHTDHVHLSWS